MTFENLVLIGMALALKDYIAEFVFFCSTFLIVNQVNRNLCWIFGLLKKKQRRLFITKFLIFIGG